MTITKLDRSALSLLRVRLDEVLKTIGDELGVTLKCGNGSYDGASIGTLKVEIAVLGKNGEQNSKGAEDFRRNAHIYGLTEKHLGRVFTTPTGARYRLLGAKPRSPKFPILAEEIKSRKTFKLMAATVTASTFDEVAS